MCEASAGVPTREGNTRSFLPSAASSLPYLFLTFVVITQHVDAALRQFECAARFSGLGVTASAN